MNRKSYIVLSCIAVVIVLALTLSLSLLRVREAHHDSSEGEGSKVVMEESSSYDSNPPENVKEEVSSGQINWTEEAANDSEVGRLQDFLDDNDDENILIQSEFLAASDSAVRRHAVIPALEWVGSPKAGMILSTLINDENEEIASDAFHALEHVFDQATASILLDSTTGEFVTEHDINDYYDMGVASLMAADDSDQCDLLMTKLSTLDVKLSLPVLLDVLEEGNAEQKRLAAEYIDRVTHGDGVTNREEAMIWLMKNQGVERVDE